jgi:hypothetical protein
LGLIYFLADGSAWQIGLKTPSRCDRKIPNRSAVQCIQLVSAKFGLLAVENRFRQPASPLLTSSNSSQQKIK